MFEYDVENIFSYHSPSKEDISVHENIRQTAKEFAKYLLSKVPSSRERSLALTHLEEVVFWANASLARKL